MPAFLVVSDERGAFGAADLKSRDVVAHETIWSRLLPATTGHSQTAALRKAIVTKELRGAEVELRFRTAEEGGRSVPPLIEPGIYRPHFIVPSGDYLGVVVTQGPSRPVSPGVWVGVEVTFPYDVSYAALSEGTAFRIMEGKRSVGEGRVLRLL